MSTTILPLRNRALASIDDPRCIPLVVRFKLDNLWDVLVKAYNLFLTIITQFIEYHANTVPAESLTIMARQAREVKSGHLEKLKSLPMNIMKKLLLWEDSPAIGHPVALLKSFTKSRFHIFHAWYAANDENCTEEDKKEIMQSFNYDHFSGEDLVTVVGRSGLLQREEVEQMVVERFRNCGECNQ